MTAAQGTGWAEAFMGGSADAERAHFAEIMPRVAYARSADHRRA
jgi:hypothetical protein